MPAPDAHGVIAAARAAGASLATAESVTGGLIAAALTTVAGSSDVVIGGIVAYTADAKSHLLGVSRDLIDGAGPVSVQVAIAMAQGALAATAATFAIASTGAAGPDSHGGEPAGTVVLAVATSAGATAERYQFDGARAAVREQAVAAALEMMRDALAT